MPGGDLYEQIVDAANDLYGSHEGRRALHAKGTWCAGTFTATPEAAELTRAAHFQGEPTPALIRFSNASGDPESDDWARDSRGMAVRLRPAGGEEADILAVTTPAFVSRNPEDFLELIRLRKPDPETGQPDWEKLGAFLGEHPESQTAVQATLNAEPPASFATLVYNSPHTFRLRAADDSPTWIRYRWRPEAGEATIPDDDAKALGSDYLSAELASAWPAARSRSSSSFRSRPRTTRSTTRRPSGPTTASASPRAGSRSPRSSTTRRAARTSRCSTRPGCPTASSCPTIRSCMPVPGPIPCPPTDV